MHDACALLWRKGRVRAQLPRRRRAPTARRIVPTHAPQPPFRPSPTRTMPTSFEPSPAAGAQEPERASRGSRLTNAVTRPISRQPALITRGGERVRAQHTISATESLPSPAGREAGWGELWRACRTDARIEPYCTLSRTASRASHLPPRRLEAREAAAATSRGWVRAWAGALCVPTHTRSSRSARARALSRPSCPPSFFPPLFRAAQRVKSRDLRPELANARVRARCDSEQRGGGCFSAPCAITIVLGSGGRAERAERAAVVRKVCDMFDEEHLFGERTMRVYVQRVSTITIAFLPFRALARQTDRGGERARRPGASGFQALHSQHSSHRSLAPAGVLVVE